MKPYITNSAIYKQWNIITKLVYVSNKRMVYSKPKLWNKKKEVKGFEPLVRKNVNLAN